jgi:hypothetical protein
MRTNLHGLLPFLKQRSKSRVKYIITVARPLACVDEHGAHCGGHGGEGQGRGAGAEGVEPGGEVLVDQRPRGRLRTRSPMLKRANNDR